MRIYRFMNDLERLSYLDGLDASKVLNRGKRAQYQRYCYYLSLQKSAPNKEKSELVMDTADYFGVEARTIYRDIRCMEQELERTL